MTREHDERSRSPSTASAGSIASPVTVPVIEERVDVGAQVVEKGRVRIDKTVTSREVLIDEPLVATEVRIERVAVDPPRAVTEPPSVRSEGDTTIIPVLEERIVKQLVVVEELRVTRSVRPIRDPRYVVLRSEHLSVEREGDEARSDDDD